MKLITWAAALVVVVALGAGVWWGADLGGSAKAQTAPPSVDLEALIAQKEGLSLDTVHKMEAAALAMAADKGLAKGTLTAGQAAAVRNVAVGPIVDELFSSTAQAVGIADLDLFNGLTQGKSLAQLAAAKGMSPDVLKAKLATVVQGEVSKQQSTGILSPAQATMIMTTWTTSADKIINESHAPETPGHP